MPETAKVFMHGRSQAVRLPKAFRLPGTEVRISRAGERVIIEPIALAGFDVAACRARPDAYCDIPFPELPEESPLESDTALTFD